MCVVLSTCLSLVISSLAVVCSAVLLVVVLLILPRLGCLGACAAVCVLTLFVAFKRLKKHISNQSLFSQRMKQAVPSTPVV